MQVGLLSSLLLLYCSILLYTLIKNENDKNENDTNSYGSTTHHSSNENLTNYYENDSGDGSYSNLDDYYLDDLHYLSDGSDGSVKI